MSSNAMATERDRASAVRALASSFHYPKKAKRLVYRDLHVHDNILLSFQSHAQHQNYLH